ncbi:hypothetical protein JCM9957A_14680 [Kineosporia succinea]
MRKSGLPLPWLGGSAEIDVPALLDGLDPDDPEEAELAMALRHAQAQVHDYQSELLRQTLPLQVRLAQAVLDLAVEWRLPQVERWAVAWLIASGEPFLRTRWSSWSRNGRQRRERRIAAQRVTVLAGFGSDVLIGASAGRVQRWAEDGSVTEVFENRFRGDVLALVGCGGKVVAGGVNGAFAAAGWPGDTAPPAPERRSGAAALATDGEGVALGEENGWVRLWRPGFDGWQTLSRWENGTGSRVSALGLEPGGVRVVWADGTLARWAGDAWEEEEHLGGQVRAAAFDSTGQFLAYTVGTRPRVRAAGRDELWGTAQLGGHRLAWSPGGLLAATGTEGTCWVGPPDGEASVLHVEGNPTAVAFAGDSYLVTAIGDRVTQWGLALAGNADPVFATSDRITAIGLEPAGPSRETELDTQSQQEAEFEGRPAREAPGAVLAATERGALYRYDPRGVLVDAEPANVGETVNRIARHGRGWLLATSDRAWFWWPGLEPKKLKPPGLGRAVASWMGEAVYAISNEVHVLGGAWHTTRPAAVEGLATHGDTLAVLDGDGTLLLHDGNHATSRPTGADRLVGMTDAGALTLTLAGLVVSAHDQATSTSVMHLTIKPNRLVPLGAGRFAGAYDNGTAVIEPGRDQRDLPQAVIVAALSTKAAVIATRAGRIVTAEGLRLTAYDLMEPDSTYGTGVVPLDLSVDESGQNCLVSVAGQPEPVRLPMNELNDLTDLAGADSLTSLTDALDRAGTLGDRLWSEGLDRALDQARGSDPDLPVRLDLRIPAEHEAGLADVPWELLHPGSEPLIWFGEPPVSMVRRVPADRPMVEKPTTRPRLRVLRADDPAFDPAVRAYDELRRRTRRVEITLPRGAVGRFGGADDLRERADVVHLWAHADPYGVVVNENLELPNDDVAAALAESGARLVVLIGCESSSLARQLVSNGVEAVVGMRLKVYTHTVHALVEAVTTAALNGTAVDRAFTRALRDYVLRGQPEAAAVPLLYLREGSTGVVFPATT